MVENKTSKLLENLRAIENSPEAREMRERLADMAKRLEDAPEGASMKEIAEDLARTRRIVDADYNLKALYGLRVKVLQEAVEFKRTGKRISLD